MKSSSGSTRPPLTASPASLATALTEQSSEPWKIAPHFAVLNAELLDLAAGETEGLIICMPPQHGKSTFVSHYFPTWYLSAFPDHRILFASYEADYASEWLVRVRDTVREHSNILGISLSSATRKSFTIKGKRGGMKSAGVGGPMTGKSGDLIIIDDPYKNAEQANSSVYRESVDNWFKSVVSTRLSPTGKIIVVVTRWHHDDLVGRLKKRMEQGGRKYRVVEMPALSEDGVRDSLNRAPSVPLWPQRYSKAWLEQQRIDIGPYFWNAQYQQRPTNANAAIIKPEWWKFYRYSDDPSMLPTPRFVLQSWDTAFKEEEQNDYSVCGTWYLTDNGFYLVDLFQERVDFPRLKIECVNRAAQWNPNLIVVEDKASGQSLVQTIRRETRLPIKPIPPVGDKVIRLHLQSGYWEAGKVYIPEGAPWTQRVLDEFNDFPRGAHDDIVDMCSQAIETLRIKMPLRTGQPAALTPKPQTDIKPRSPRRDSSYLKGFA